MSVHHSEDLLLAASYYGERYRAHGDTPQGMDWKNVESQRLRFERLLCHVDLSGRPSLLDVGCGNGELLTFLGERGIAVDYLGIDICPEMVEACCRRHGAGAARLASTQELDTLPRRHDYALASGTFNVKLAAADEEWEGYFFAAVEAMYRHCRVATVVNVLTTLVDFSRPHLFHFDPGKAPELARRCGTRRFAVDHGYPLYELTVALWRP